MKIKRIDFDVNGTLFNDTPQLLEALSCIFDHFGKPRMPLRELRQQFTQPWTKMYREAGITEEMASHAKLYELYNSAYQKQPPPAPSLGVREVLHWLYRRGIPATIVSTQQNDITLPLLDQHALNLLFSRVEGGVHDKAETILALCSEMDVSPQEVAYVGDQDSDMRFARAAGCIAVAYLGGVHTKTKLAKAGAQYFLKDFRELKTLPIIK
ncbi:MAG: hypothetical protein A2806_04115 [Candidatus Terrybacteria bacterium RIFCSPHIGHO2_01_FULL_48_17]|uniref:Haloacid dehalogenase n=1 Tax=Candidatus Terrybacteria bacterium RIFCSPHIGHO2_01_FULL_48_17 TaxID=1802362 RepID=A0A1G2PKQ0_9BACT|nr:MAG: hypothetical protein A2806_04115 [Candidatus Terrybacteria bacterium RIFCSPHIGHO2_01_FULL_48_17]OHA53740.1 MAG: hypothetical protein A3A30_05220 [Candidatus Terrybacteria bacterium RIFCSPLOWO2_01_FULL_48_14]